MTDLSNNINVQVVEPHVEPHVESSPQIIEQIRLVINDPSPSLQLVPTLNHQNSSLNLFSNSSSCSNESNTLSTSTSEPSAGGDNISSSSEEPHSSGKLHENYRSYKDIVRLMSEKFNTEDNINSTALDIISFYLKGQKIIQIESKIYCEYYLYRLMLPAIFISTICSVISGIFKDSINASIAVCLMTALNTFILTMVTYLKLDAKAEAHKTSAYSYDKLQTMCEFSSGRILLNTIAKDDHNYRSMGNLLDDIEKQVMEIKEKNQFIIPAYIRNNYPKLYYTNIFSVVKQIQNEEVIYMNQLKVIMNKGVDITNEINRTSATRELLEKKSKQYIEKNEAINNLVHFRDKYYELDREFKKEIEQNILRKNKKWYTSGCCCKYSSNSNNVYDNETHINHFKKHILPSKEMMLMEKDKVTLRRNKNIGEGRMGNKKLSTIFDLDLDKEEKNICHSDKNRI